MLMLCLDTSAGSAVALARDGAVLARARSADPRRHTESLAPMIEQVLAEAGESRASLEAVAVGRGPAPFTGLRVGLVTARTFARALGIPVYGVSSLDVLARQALDERFEEQVVVVADARRREVYWAHYAAHGQHDVRRLAGPEVADPARVPRVGAVVVSGGATAYSEVLEPAELVEAPDAAVLARIVRARLAENPGREDLSTEPLYLRRPDVQAPSPPKRATARHG